jgi:hypothetical protein
LVLGREHVSSGWSISVNNQTVASYGRAILIACAALANYIYNIQSAAAKPASRQAALRLGECRAFGETLRTGEEKMIDRKTSGLGCAVGTAALALLFACAANAQTFIYGNSAGNGMYQIDKNTGAVIKACPQTKGNGRGMVVVASVVYFTVADTGNVYKTNFATCSDDGVAFAVPGATSLSTIAFDGTNFWVGDYTSANRAFYVSPSGALLNTINLANCAGNCDGLEFFNGKLIANRGDAATQGYDVYSLSGGAPITADFIAPTAFAATGIAFDGTNFYVSDIFNQKLQVYDGTTGAFIKTVTITGMTLANVIEDLSADYSIVIGGGGPKDIPTMSEWALILMAGLIALLGIYGIGRRLR